MRRSALYQHNNLSLLRVSAQPSGHIQSHSDEDDPEHLAFLLKKGEENRKWVLQKYGIKDPYESR